MSPRPYKVRQRRAAIDETRARVLDAARALLGDPAGVSGFTMDAVARRADVARMTVYYQFGSKAGLLEALCDSLAARGGMERLATAFRQPRPLRALREFILIFARFWGADRLVTRRLHGLAALDPDFARVISARQERRREGLRVLVGRLAETHGRPTADAVDGAIEILWTLTSFETFDSLAGETRAFEEVAPTIHRLALAALGLDEDGHDTGLSGAGATAPAGGRGTGEGTRE
jgi:AcrR family transcriptional regulator